MAEFCNQCAEDLKLKKNDFLDFCSEGYCVLVVCEDCGITYVDHLGYCVNPNCTKQHGKTRCLSTNSSSASPPAPVPVATIGQLLDQFFAHRAEQLEAHLPPSKKKKAK